MPAVSETTPTVGTPARVARPPWRTGVVAGLAAAAVNAAVWALGHARGVDFLVHPGGAAETAEVSVAQVLVTSFVMVLLGWAVLRVATRRSARWRSAVLAVAAVTAVATTWGPLTTAVEPASGLFLATMHLVAGAAFLAAALVSRGSG